MAHHPHPVLDLIHESLRLGGIEVWVFGSSLRRADPNDIDVLIVYDEMWKAAALRRYRPWELVDPPVDLIAMCQDEVDSLHFIEATSAIRLL